MNDDVPCSCRGNDRTALYNREESTVRRDDVLLDGALENRRGGGSRMGHCSDLVGGGGSRMGHYTDLIVT